jgi:hypothetical protein
LYVFGVFAVTGSIFAPPRRHPPTSLGPTSLGPACLGIAHQLDRPSWISRSRDQIYQRLLPVGKAVKTFLVTLTNQTPRVEAASAIWF